jgi:peptidoglycan hydrolase CwlO-like protein
MFKRFLIWLGWFFAKHSLLFIVFCFAVALTPFFLLLLLNHSSDLYDLYLSLVTVISFVIFFIFFFTVGRYGSRNRNWRVAIDYAGENFKENNRVLDLIPKTRETKDPTEINQLMDLLDKIEAKRKELQSLTDKLVAAFKEANKLEKEIDNTKKEVAELEERLLK